MPIFEQLEETQALPGSGLPRTPGLHLTDVITRIEEDMGWRDQKNKWDDEPLHLAGEIGFMWEDILSKTYADRMATIRPGEYTEDGIICSPDGLGFDPEDEEKVVLEEYKATFRSAKWLLTDNWRYITQVQSYLHVTGLDTCIMRVLYLNGLWNGKGPIRKTARLTFSRIEIRENWDMILETAKEMENE